MRIAPLPSIIALSLAAAACSQGDDQVTTSANAESEADNAAVNAALGGNAPSAAMPTDAAGFANAVAASDMFELESAKLALAKSSDTDVKGIAQMLQRDHTQSTADLKSAASGAGITVTPALDAEKQGMLDALNAASGADFDKLFMNQQRTAHQKALMLLQNYSQSGDNDALKAFAAKVQPVIEHHMDRVNAIPK